MPPIVNSRLIHCKGKVAILEKRRKHKHVKITRISFVSEKG